MLTDAALKSLKPKAKMYKVSDRDGMYVRVAPSGAISFRLDYRLHGRRETVYLGRYARDGISLARARELCIDARRAITEGRSPAIEKQREKRRRPLLQPSTRHGKRVHSLTLSRALPGSCSAEGVGRDQGSDAGEGFPLPVRMYKVTR